MLAKKRVAPTDKEQLTRRILVNLSNLTKARDLVRLALPYRYLRMEVLEMFFLEGGSFSKEFLWIG